MNTVDSCSWSVPVGSTVQGRDATPYLRTPAIASNDLAESIITSVQELTSGLGSVRGTPLFRVSIEGSPRELRPVVRDDVQRIWREASRNAFCHAQASHVEADVTYGFSELRVCIRDDGKGIDAAQLSASRARHWGLTSMHERAAQIGAQLNLWSGMRAGTEVELRIPSIVAYGARDRCGSMFRLRRQSGGWT